MNKHYNNWIKREVEKGYNKNDVVASAEHFIANKQKFKARDIYSWDAKELENAIKDMAEKVTSRNRGEYETIKETNDFLLIRLIDKQSAHFWGKGTKWCITMLESNYFSSYRSESNVVFYVIVNKKAKSQSKDSKFCIVLYRNKKNEIENTEIYNSSDSVVKFSSLPQSMQSFLE